MRNHTANVSTATCETNPASATRAVVANRAHPSSAARLLRNRFMVKGTSWQTREVGVYWRRAGRGGGGWKVVAGDRENVKLRGAFRVEGGALTLLQHKTNREFCTSKVLTVFFRVKSNKISFLYVQNWNVYDERSPFSPFSTIFCHIFI